MEIPGKIRLAHIGADQAQCGGVKRDSRPGFSVPGNEKKDPFRAFRETGDSRRFPEGTLLTFGVCGDII